MTDSARGALDEADLLVSRALIGGEWLQGEREPIAVEDPFTLSNFAEVPNLGAAETERAIAAASSPAAVISFCLPCGSSASVSRSSLGPFRPKGSPATTSFSFRSHRAVLSQRFARRRETPSRPPLPGPFSRGSAR